MTGLPEWPRTESDWKRITVLANWTEDQRPEAFVRWEDEYRARQPAYLTRTEKGVLLEAFSGRGSRRWSGVAQMLRSGSASDRFIWTVSHLVELRGFDPRANLTDYSAVERARDLDLVVDVLKRSFPLQPLQAVRRMPTKIASILLHPASETPDSELARKQTADVTHAAKLVRDKKTALQRVCWRVARDPTSD